MTLCASQCEKNKDYDRDPKSADDNHTHKALLLWCCIYYLLALDVPSAKMYDKFRVMTAKRPRYATTVVVGQSESRRRIIRKE